MGVTLAFILLMAVGTYGVTGWMSQVEEQRCFERLDEETGNLCRDIEAQIRSDREQLEMLAALAVGYENLECQALWEILDSYGEIGMMSRVEILMPDDTVITSGGKRLDVQGQLSFERETALGAHISDRETDLTDTSQCILRHYVPIVKDNETIAMLYGIGVLGNLPEGMEMQPYGGQAAIYLVDGNNGDFLVDTWHEELGNLWALGERKMAPGYDTDQIRQDFNKGEEGYVVFVSETTGSNLYFYYEPMGVNEWRVALSVPEDVVFSNVREIKKALNLFLAFEALCFLGYFLWMACDVWRETNEKQKQLDTIHYINEIEKLLFNAHEKQENMGDALAKIADITAAEKVCFQITEKAVEDISFLWDGSKKQIYKEETPWMKGTKERLLNYFQEGNSQFLALDEKSLKPFFPECRQRSVTSMMAIPVEGFSGEICGILSALNLSQRPANPNLLKNVNFSFSMFCHNMKGYSEIKARGEKDFLTGMYNRNRYETDLPKLPEIYRKSLACAYIDANELHELNNSKGHDAGDAMLKAVAGQIRSKFGTEYTYRIGGDEFLAFVVDMEKEQAELLGRELEQALAEKNFHISVGVQWEAKISTMNDLVKGAEKKMYLAKKEYYAQEGHDRRRRAD